MKALDLSLETIVVGGRGQDKTLLMTHFITEALQRAILVKALRQQTGRRINPKAKVNIWSNYPYKALWRSKYFKKPYMLEPEHLDIDRLVKWEPEFRDGLIYFDEIDQIADRQDWYSTVAKFLTAGVQIIRHRNLSLILSIQSLEWLNARLQWQADIIIKCKDMAFTPWGRTNNLQPGMVAQTTWIDKSGVNTGTPFEEKPQIYQMLFFGKRYWNAYKTEHEFNITDYKTKYNVKYQTKEIDLTGQDKIEEKNLEAINNALSFLIYNNNDKIGSNDFWLRASEFGLQGDHKKYVQYLRERGVQEKVVSGGKIYILENVPVS